MEETIFMLFEIYSNNQNLTNLGIEFQNPCSGSEIIEFINSEIKSNFKDYKLIRVLYLIESLNRKLELRPLNSFNKTATFEIQIEKIVSSSDENYNEFDKELEYGIQSNTIINEYENIQCFNNSLSYEPKTNSDKISKIITIEKLNSNNENPPNYLEEKSSDSETIRKIKEIVKKSNKLKNIPNPSSPQSVDWRINLISAIAKYLIYELSTEHKPSKSIKIEFAKGIIYAFPFLKNDKLKDGYEHIYNPQNDNGFLGQTIRNIRCRDNKIEKRIYNKRKFNEIENEIENEHLDEDLMKGHISVLKSRLPNTEDNKNQIINLMKLTSIYRKDWIQNQQPFISEILKMYPRYVQMPYLIDEDFKEFFDKARTIGNNFINKWSTIYTRKIVKYMSSKKDKNIQLLVEKYNDSIDEDEQSLIAVELLCLLVASNNIKGKTKKIGNSVLKNFIFQKFKSGTPPDEISKECNETTFQPVLVILDNKQIFLKLEDQLISLEQNFSTSLDLLYKSFWVFNVEYPAAAVTFYYFLEIIYGMEEKTRPGIEEHHQKILLQ